MQYPSLVERITRSLAYMLRHQPEQFDLELDEYGCADLDDVVAALNERLGEPVEAEDVSAAVEGGDRPRYEIREGKIRALYGHSIQVKPGEPAKPPALLYVGISKDDAERARRYGLRPGRRSFLHLALTPEDALETGRRASRDYVVITVNALEAWEEGINFYDRRSLFLSDPIPTHFLQVGELRTDGYGEEGDEVGRGRPGRFDPDRREAHPAQAARESQPARRDAGPRSEEGRPEEPSGGQEHRREEPRREESRPFEHATETRPETARGDRGGDRGGGRFHGPRGRDSRRERRPSREPQRVEPGAMRPERPGALRPEQPGALRPEQSGAMRPEQPGALRPEQSGALRPEQPGAMRPEQPGALGPEHQGGPRSDHAPRQDRGHDRPREERRFPPRRRESHGDREAPRDAPRERDGRREPRGPVPSREPAQEPMRSRAEPSAAPAGSGASENFGLGVFESPPRSKAPEPKAAETHPPLREERREPARPEREVPAPEESGGFGAGI